MNKFILAASAALAAVAMASGASATVNNTINLSSGVTDTFTGVVGPGLFSDVFSFTLSTPSSLTSSSITSIFTVLKGAGDIDFSSVSFDGVTPFNLVTNFGGDTDVAYVSGVYLAAGAHNVTVSGFAYGNASYGGNINITPVPEPSTWAMMLAGIAALGFTMRRRAARIAFA